MNMSEQTNECAEELQGENDNQQTAKTESETDKSVRLPLTCRDEIDSTGKQTERQTTSNGSDGHKRPSSFHRLCNGFQPVDSAVPAVPKVVDSSSLKTSARSRHFDKTPGCRGPAIGCRHRAELPSCPRPAFHS